MLVLVAMSAAELNRLFRPPAKSEKAAPVAAATGPLTLTKLSEHVIPMPAGVPSAHASAMASLPGGDMMAFWWAGSRESGPDVKVYGATWKAGT